MKWNIENTYSSEEVGFFLTQIKVRKEKQCGINGDALLNDFMIWKAKVLIQQ